MTGKHISCLTLINVNIQSFFPVMFTGTMFWPNNTDFCLKQRINIWKSNSGPMLSTVAQKNKKNKKAATDSASYPTYKRERSVIYVIGTKCKSGSFKEFV